MNTKKGYLRILHRLKNKFGNAFSGIRIALKTDSGVRIQFSIAVFTIVICLFLDLTLTQWLIVLLCIGAVITAELLNTAIEEIVDALSAHFTDSEREKIKDISAGAVLVMALTSLIIMILILLSKGAL